MRQVDGWLGAGRVMALTAAVLTAACSSSISDDQRPGWAQQAYPALSEDSNPAGGRIDVRSQNLFAARAGDTWVFDRALGSNVERGALVLSVARVEGDAFTMAETLGGTTRERTYRRTSNGITLVNPLPSAPAAAQRQVGEMLWYPEPFYAVDATRTMTRQGSWGADTDNDGGHESFRYTVTQAYLGFESVAIPSGTVQAARFRTSTTLQLVSSNPNAAIKTETSAEETWWAPNLGLVRMTVASSTPGAAAATTSVFSLAGGILGGVAVAPPAPAPVTPPPVVTIDGSLLKLDLPHNALVYDAGRSRYYAAVAPAAGAHGNRVATIDAATGQTTFSDIVGDNPTAMAMSVDGAYLFVGIRGTGELSKYRLPEMQLQSTVKLPLGVDGELQFAESLTVSPLNPTFVAIALAQGATDIKHRGVVMSFTGELTAPVMQGLLANNSISFDATGDHVYGLQREGNGLGLTRSMAPFGQNLQFADASTTAGGKGARTVDVTAQGLWVGDALYRASDLGLLGRANVKAGACRALRPSTSAVCLDSDATSDGAGRLAVVDATTLATRASATYALSGLTVQPFEVVPGPAKKVALRFPSTGASVAASSLWLFTSDKLQ